jgi:CheY-like chemotaxis protein
VPMTIEPPIILIVDNDPEVCMLLRRLIHSFAPSCEIVVATSGARALAVIIARPIALVITDYHMPGMNGVQLTRAIKGILPLARVAIMSAEDARDLAQQVRGVAVDYILSKPYDRAQLRQMIKESIPSAGSDE